MLCLRGPSSGDTISIAPSAFLLSEPGKRIDCRAVIGMGIKPTPTRGSDPPPMAYEERTAEKVWPHLDAVVTPLVPLGPNSDEGSGILKQHELHRSGAAGMSFPTIAHSALIRPGLAAPQRLSAAESTVTVTGLLRTSRPPATSVSSTWKMTALSRFVRIRGRRSAAARRRRFGVAAWPAPPICGSHRRVAECCLPPVAERKHPAHGGDFGRQQAADSQTQCFHGSQPRPL
jgi:hypothetical protein